MADRGHELTDEILEDLEKRLAKEYKQAAVEMEEKLQAYLEKFAAEDEVQRKLLEAGKITTKDYQDWRFRHIMMNKRWEAMRDTLAEDYHRVNQIAAGIYRGERAGIYALNHNYAVYQMEHDAGIDTGLTLYNRDAVERILTQNPDMLPPPGKRVSKRIAEGKDIRWNNQQIQSVMTQGILQGESIPKLAHRLETVTEHNFTAAMRNARTMATGAQNAGRHEAYERAERKGVHLIQEWQATLDGRTRHDHRMLHGVRIPIDEKFQTPDGELEFPGDPSGPPGQVYNCRCTTLSWVKGFEGDTVKYSPKMGDMTFEEWQEAGERRSAPTPQSKIKTGDLPPHMREYSNYSDYRAAANVYNGELSYYSSGDSAFYGPGWYDDGAWENVKRFDATIEQLYNDYPLPNGAGLDIGDYRTIDTYLTERQKASTMSDDAAAQCWHNWDTGRYAIGYNPGTTYQSYADALRERQRIIDSGGYLLDVSGGSAEGVAIHEWGHAMSDYISNAMVFEDPAAMEYWDWYKSLSKDAIRNGISSYAATNRYEFEAECFAELLTPNPRPIAVKYRDYLASCMEANYNDKGRGEPVVSAIQNLARRRNVSDMPTFFLEHREYKLVQSELSTWVDPTDCPVGTLQFKTIFNEFDNTNYVYWFERTGNNEFRIVGRSVKK